MADATTGVAETPLQYLLRRIPRDAIYRWTTPEADRAAWQLASNSAPIGRLAHEAADRLDAAASPPAREEAPAEGAGLLEWISETACGVEDRKAAVALRMIEDRVNTALRNRTSEPEAGAVAWRIEDLILPQVMITEDAGFAKHKAEYRYEGEATARVTPLFTHPAPASADKLKVAVEALEKADAAARSGAAMCAADYRVDPEKLGEVIYTITTPALAALNEGGKG